MSKFKVGDKVRVTYGWALGTVGTIKRYAPNGTFIMKANEKPNHSYYEDENDDWCFHSADDLVELVIEQPRREFIVIRRSGAETIAELRHDREVIKSGRATCNASDTFDFSTGAKLAFDRLMGREEPKRESLADIFEQLTGRAAPVLQRAPEPPKFYTGKVFACDSQDTMFRKRDGYIFEFSNGLCVNARPDQRIPTFNIFRDIAEIRKRMSLTTWHEVKSDV